MSDLLVLLFVATVALVIWATVDVTRHAALSSGAKRGWIVGFVLGTLAFGVVGLINSPVYIVGVRPRLAQRD
jgi:phosphotransferase system  glucose/maltose/N-acetylglucosamine-specific IIC component